MTRKSNTWQTLLNLCDPFWGRTGAGIKIIAMKIEKGKNNIFKFVTKLDTYNGDSHNQD